MKKSLLRITLIAIALSIFGCATDYKQYSEAVTSIEVAKHNAEAEKYKAMAAIAATGSDAAKVAAVMSITLSGQLTQAQGSSALRAPETAGDTALRWASLVIPTVVQSYGIHANALLGMRQSDNAALVAQSTNNAFVGMAGKIQAPQPNVSTTTTTTTTNTDSHNISGSYNPIITTPTITTNTTGSNNPSSTADSHNTAPVR